MVNRDRVHAAMVNRAMPQLAWAAEGLSHRDFGTSSEGSRLEFIRRAENRQGRDSEPCGNMHRAGIVGNEEIAALNQIHKLTKGSFSREGERRDSGTFDHRLGQSGLHGRSKEDADRIVLTMKSR